MIRKLFSLVFILSVASCAQLVAPKASVQQMEFDFGDIQQGTVVSHNYVIVNNGGDTLKILKVNPSCGCTAAKPDKDVLMSGEATNIKVEFNSAGRTGKQDKYVFVQTNEPGNPQLKLKFTGNVIKTEVEIKADISSLPKMLFTESTHDFGSVKEGNKVNYTFKFKNAGKSVLEIKDVKTSCGCTAALISDKVIEPGQEGTLKVELDTKGRTGKMSRNVTINSNDPDEPQKLLVIYAEVSKGDQ